MATVSFLRWTSTGTGYINAVDSQTINVTGSSFTWTPPTFTTYAALPYNNNPTYRYLQMSRAIFRLPTASGGTNTTYLTSGQSGYTANGAWSGAVGWDIGSKSFTTNTFFSSSNSTTRTITGTLNIPYELGLTATDAQSSSSIMYPTAEQTLTTVYVTLDAPPTFKVTDSGGTETTQVYYDTNFVYAGLTTASIKVANLSAKYGGTITSATLTIGDQTVSRTNNGELSILLNVGGTFTPTVTVTDSRGQTTTKTLDPITVNVYTTPTVNFEAQRTLATGVPDDEGTYAVINPKFTFVDVIAELQAPTITAKDEGSITYTPTVTWYSSRASDGTLSGSVTWSSLSSGDTVYGRLSLQSGFDVLQSYQISVTPIDSKGTGTAKTQMLAPAFFTIDVLAGGHGIAFGTPAVDEVFECAMPTSFLDMTSQEIDDFVDSIGGGGDPIADVVVEADVVSGTNGKIRWHKWSSGRLEIDIYFRDFTLTSYGTSAVIGGYGFNYPLDWVNSSGGKCPACIDTDYTVTTSWVIASGHAVPSTIFGRTTSGCTLYALGELGGTQSIQLNIHIVGEWK